MGKNRAIQFKGAAAQVFMNAVDDGKGKAFMEAIEWIDTARADLLKGDRVDALDSLHMAEERVRQLLPQTPGDAT